MIVLGVRIDSVVALTEDLTEDLTGDLTEPTVMTDVFANPTVRLTLAVPVLLILIAFGFWLMGRLRDYTTEDRHEPLGALVNLEEMLRNGDISEEEFRTIKASARSRLEASSTKRSETES